MGGIFDAYGRHYSIKGAGLQNTLSNWLSQRISKWTRETETRTVSDRNWDLYQNTSIGHGILEGLITNVIGTGITPVFTPNKFFTGFTPDESIEYSNNLKQNYDVWANDPRKFCDIQKRMAFARQQALSLFLWKLEGISFFKVVYKPERYSPFNIKLQPLDSYFVRTPYEFLQSENFIDGIEIDNDGKPVRVWYARTTLNNNVRAFEKLEIYDNETGLPKILLTTDVRNIHEYRQSGALTCMMKELKDMDEATDAVIVKFVLQNLLTLFMKEPSQLSTVEETLNYDIKFVEYDKGTVMYGPPGSEPVPLKASDQPNESYNLLHDKIFERLGAALGRGPESLRNQFSTSFTAARANMMQSKRVDSSDRQIIIKNFAEPIVMWLVYDAFLNGKIKINKSLEEFKENLYAYSQTSWLPQPERHIDELKQRTAEKVALGDGTTTYTDIFSEQGHDVLSQFRKIAQEIKVIEEIEKEFSVDLSFMKRSVTDNVVIETNNPNEE